MPFAALLLLACASLFPATVADRDSDRDSDRDGLSDFQEEHKYFTDPHRRDSDGDGVPDGDWEERREYSYSVRTVLRVLRPYNIEAMTDDYQDARVLKETREYLEAEVIHYPFNTNAESIDRNENWRRDAARWQKYLRPGVTSNWDRRMRQQLLSELRERQVDPDRLDDRELVRQVSKWLMDRSTFEDGFTTFAVDFKRGEPHPAAGMERTLEREIEKSGLSLEEQWERELFGKGMFDAAVHGSCTSAAIYLQTGLRACGIPTRTIICVPAVDASDGQEVRMLDQLTHHGMRRLMKICAEERGHSWASHTFNEVFVAGRWRRLNYSRLGQNILADGNLGLMTHVNTFADHAEAGLSSWGLRYQNRPNDTFGGANPYSCVEISDLFGAHAEVDNPTLLELSRFDVSRVYWFDDPDKPAVVDMRLDDADSAGHLVLHLEPGPVGVRRSDYEELYARIDKQFVLRAAGHPDVAAVASRGFWVQLDEGVREFYLRIEPDQFRKMKPGVRYQLAPIGQSGGSGWSVKEGLFVIRR